MKQPSGNPRRDRRLLRRLALGDSEALTELFDTYGDRLFAHAIWLTRRRQDAEDAVQTVFVKLAESGSQLLRVRRPAAYLHQMVRSAAIDRIRSESRRSEEPLDDQLLVVEGDAGRRAELSLVEGKLASLPIEQREAVSLHLFDGFTFREIGEMTDVSRFTAASRYRLAIRALRKELEEE